MSESGLIEILDDKPKQFPPELFDFAQKQKPILPFSTSNPSNKQILEILEKIQIPWTGLNPHDLKLQGDLPIPYHGNPTSYRPYSMSVGIHPIQVLDDCVPIMITNLLRKVPGHEQQVASYQELKRYVLQAHGDPKNLANYMPLLKQMGIYTWKCADTPAELTAAALMKVPLIAIAPRTWHAYSLKAHSQTDITLQEGSAGRNMFISTPYFYTETTDRYADGTVENLQTVLHRFDQNSLVALLPSINRK